MNSVVAGSDSDQLLSVDGLVEGRKLYRDD